MSALNKPITINPCVECGELPEIRIDGMYMLEISCETNGCEHQLKTIGEREILVMDIYNGIYQWNEANPISDPVLPDKSNSGNICNGSIVVDVS